MTNFEKLTCNSRGNLQQLFLAYQVILKSTFNDIKGSQTKESNLSSKSWKQKPDNRTALILFSEKCLTRNLAFLIMIITASFQLVI